MKPGDLLPPFEKTFTTVDLFAYGAATWDWHRMHYDAELARSKGFAAPVIDGQMYGAVFAQVAMRWAGPGRWTRWRSPPGCRRKTWQRN